MDIESQYKNESPLQLPSRLNSLDTGGKKQHIKLTWVLEKTSFSFLCGIFSITELDAIYFLSEIFPP